MLVPSVPMSEHNATTSTESANIPNAPATPKMAYLHSSPLLPFGYAVYHWPQTYHPHPIAMFASPSHQSTPTQNVNPQEMKREYLSKAQKVQRIFALLDKWEWSLGDLLVNIFTEEVDEEGRVKDSGHNLRIQNFLSGSTKHTPAHVMKI
jgi:hypothetical protein